MEHNVSISAQLNERTNQSFPFFKGYRRHLSFDSDYFAQANIFHYEPGRAAAKTIVYDEKTQKSKEDSLEGSTHLQKHDIDRHECMTCQAVLPSHHLLDIHITEMHDSYFAAQAARKLHVYLCLVESCHKKFSSIEDRKQHLIMHHKFPKSYNFDRLHLRRKKGQIRPLPEYQKSSRVDAMRAEGKMPDLHDHEEEQQELFSEEIVLCGGDVDNEKERKNQTGDTVLDSGIKSSNNTAGSSSEDLVQGFSRLHMAAERSSVPSTIAFGSNSKKKGIPGLE